MGFCSMNIELKAKYLSDRPMQGYAAKPRTGNSHGPTKDKMPAHQPCKRATAGAKTFVATVGHETLLPSGKQNHRARVLVVNGLTGAKRMEDLAAQ